MNDSYTHSIQLDQEKCIGCTNCVKRCPTQAIRVWDGKAHISHELCIDCGECVRACASHAKVPVYDPIERMDDYKYKVALPAPSLCGQFNNLEDSNIVLTALRQMGFDMVYEVASAAEIVSEMSRQYIEDHPEKWPLISTACPAVLKLIRLKFPGLVKHLLPIQPPVEIAAEIARKQAMEKSGLPSEEIGIFFISPCPAKVFSCRAPIGVDKTEVDATLAMKDVYVKILPYMKKAVEDPEDLSRAGRIGIGWGTSGGEAAGLLNDHYLAADGIENCIRVLNQLEDQSFPQLRFVELDSCPGGCVGGVLAVENPYIAKTKLMTLKKYLPVSGGIHNPEDTGYWTHEVEPETVLTFEGTLVEKMRKMAQVEELLELFPGIDCGSCGAPSCRALAEDIVRGKAEATDCVHYVMHNYVNQLSKMINDIEKTPGQKGIKNLPTERNE